MTDIPHNRSDRGFSLIELSVIIGILASLAIGYMQWINPPTQNNAEKIQATMEKIDIISESLLNYTILYNRLPCPADPSIRQDGTRHSSSSRTQDFEYAQEGLIYTDSNGVDCPFSVGTVPVAVLNLPYRFMYDQWGNQITYHVSPNLCGDDANVTGLSTDQEPLVGCTSRDYEFGININSANNSGNLIVLDSIGTTIVDDAAFILVSHGPNGSGSYLESGVKVTDSTNANELENSDSLSAFPSDLTYVKDQISATFDDIVSFKTREQILMLSKNYQSQLVSKEDCEANSQAIKDITITEYNDMDLVIDDYQVDVGGGEIYNKGGSVILGVLMELQNACSDTSYYGESDDGDGWSGTQCPGGAPPPVDGVCTCADGSWDGTC